MRDRARQGMTCNKGLQSDRDSGHSIIVVSNNQDHWITIVHITNRTSPKNGMNNSICIKLCLFIYVLLHRMSQTSFYHPTTTGLPLGSQREGRIYCIICAVCSGYSRVSFYLDMSRMPLQEKCLACILIWSEPSQLDECEDCQPHISLPVSLMLHPVSMTLVLLNLYNASLSPPVQSTIMETKLLLQIGCF